MRTIFTLGWRQAVLVSLGLGALIGLASGLVQSSGQVGTALVLAVVTALVSTGAGAAGDFGQFHPGLNLVTGVAVAGLLLNVIPLVATVARPRSA